MLVDYTLLSVLGALVTSVLFACGVQCVRKGLGHGAPSGGGTVISIFTAVALFTLLLPLFVSLADFRSPALLLFMLIGLFRPAISANMANLGNYFLGPTLSSSVASVTPVVAIAGSVLLLGEALELFTGAGALLVVAGIIILSWRGRTGTGWPKLALLLPLGTACLRAMAHVLGKYGMNILPNPFLNTWASMSVSLIIIASVAFLRNPQGLLHMPRKGLWWFALAGLINGSGALLLNVSLNWGKVSIISPIAASSPVFTMLLGRYLFRQETLTLRQGLGVCSVALGVGLVAAFR